MYDDAATHQMDVVNLSEPPARRSYKGQDTPVLLHHLASAWDRGCLHVVLTLWALVSLATLFGVVIWVVSLATGSDNSLPYSP